MSSTHEGAPLRVGVVGASIADSPDGRDRWAIRAHLPALVGMPRDFHLTAVCTSRIETAQAAADRFGVSQAYGSVDDMLREADIDAVCVSLQPHLHFDVALKCLKAGKHVYCEQPMGVSTEQARILAAEAARRGLKTLVGHRNSHVPQVLYMAHLIATGYIGTPLTFQHNSFTSAYIQPRPRHRTWLFQTTTGRPAHRSANSFDRVMAVLGSPVVELVADIANRVQSRPAMDGGDPIPGDLPDNMAYLVRLASGISGTVQVSKTAWFGDKERFDVFGTEGMLRLTTENPPADQLVDLKRYNIGGLRLLGAPADIDEIIRRKIRPESLWRPEPILPPSEFVLAGELDPDQEPFIVGQAWKVLRQAVNGGDDARASFAEGLLVHQVLDAAEASAGTQAWAAVNRLVDAEVPS